MSESDDILSPNSGGFRDHIGTVKEDGSRNWIFPKMPKGRLYNARKWVSAVLLLMLFSGPFIYVNGHPLFLFNILERKFVLFGVPFWTQDFHLFVLAMITGVVFVTLFTVVFGRVWCGWACPQTIFMEMIFRRIEYWIEGDSNKQRKLDQMPWKGEKIRKKALKWSIFFAISYLIGNLLLVYIVGRDEWFQLLQLGPAARPDLFGATLVFSLIFFGVFAYFREQACIVVCPYGRLQGVLLTRDSMAVSYDHMRGEPRGKIRKGEDAYSKGDCVDCSLCVQVCPTGIDIRDGLQMECVNCTACIDACDAVMEKVDRPKGLIRVASENMIANREKFRMSSRVWAYSVLLLGLVVVLTTSLVTVRSDIEATILRQAGMLYRPLDSGRAYDNLYNYQIVNKTMDSMNLGIRLLEPAGEIMLVGEDSIHLDPQGISKGLFFVVLEADKLQGQKTPIKLQVMRDTVVLDQVRTNFLGPIRLSASSQND